jgi:hypothetical protein
VPEWKGTRKKIQVQQQQMTPIVALTRAFGRGSVEVKMGRLNRPEIPGYIYRSPNRTNARDLTPHPLEDAGASQEADLERIRRGLRADAGREHNRRLQQEAGGRAALRTGTRAGLAGLAYEGGKAAGRALDEEYPELGKKIVDIPNSEKELDKLLGDI